MKKKVRNYWSDGLSINESRVSVLIILLLLSFGFAGYCLIQTGDIPMNLVQIMIALITAVAGVNIADSFANRNTTQSIDYLDFDRPLDDDQRPTI